MSISSTGKTIMMMMMMTVKTTLVTSLLRSHADKLFYSMFISTVTDGGGGTGLMLIFSDCDGCSAPHRQLNPGKMAICALSQVLGLGV